jgi:hypothetical protein
MAESRARCGRPPRKTRKLARTLTSKGCQWRQQCSSAGNTIELTDIGAGLRPDTPGEQRTAALLFGHEMMGRS